MTPIVWISAVVAGGLVARALALAWVDFVNRLLPPPRPPLPKPANDTHRPVANVVALHRITVVA